MPRLTIFCHLSLVALVGIAPTSIYTEDVVVIVSLRVIGMVRSSFWFGRETIHGLGPIAIGLEPVLYCTMYCKVSPELDDSPFFEPETNLPSYNLPTGAPIHRQPRLRGMNLARRKVGSTDPRAYITIPFVGGCGVELNSVDVDGIREHNLSDVRMRRDSCGLSGQCA